MNIDIIDKEFRRVIMIRGAYRALKISHQHQKLLRNHLRRGIFISIDKKIRLLQRFGVSINDDYIYSHKNAIEIISFVLKASESAKQLGPEYLLEKFNSRPAPKLKTTRYKA
jgi:hypothetical protein